MQVHTHTRTVHVHLPRMCVLTQIIILSLQVETRETKSKNDNLGDSMTRTYKPMKQFGKETQREYGERQPNTDVEWKPQALVLTVLSPIHEYDIYLVSVCMTGSLG